MRIQLRILLAFLALFVACSIGYKRDQAREVLARLRRSAKRASDALDLLQSESACDKATGSHGWDQAQQAMASDDCPDWLTDYFRNQRP
jgi:hypothetical protein